MVDAYRAVIDDPAAHDVAPADGPPRQLVWGVARLLADDGHPAEATQLLHHLVEQARQAPRGSTDGPDGDARLRAALLNLGAAHWSNGDLAAASEVLSETVERCRAAGDPSMLSAALGNLAMVERDLGRLDTADAMFVEEAELCTQLDDEFRLQSSLGNRAQLLRSIGALRRGARAPRGAGTPLPEPGRPGRHRPVARRPGRSARRSRRRGGGDRTHRTVRVDRVAPRAIDGASSKRCSTSP